jgi:TetR/AcrR family transcriptional regulator, transcriptional repressor for nem operon
MSRPRAFDEDTVLDRALDLFWHRGYEATSMQQLVDTLGINRASLYDTFGDKYQLFRRTMDRHQQRIQASVYSLLEQDLPAPQLLREFLEAAITESVADTQGRGCFFVNCGMELAAHDPAIAQFLLQNQQTLEAKLEATIRRGQAEGDISPTHSPLDLARFVYNTLTGLKATAKTNPDEAALRSVVAVAMCVLTTPMG